jgi:hypothetical protein
VTTGAAPVLDPVVLLDQDHVRGRCAVRVNRTSDRERPQGSGSVVRKDYYRLAQMEVPMDDSPRSTAAHQQTLALLVAGVPLSLLLDLALPLDSAALLRDEPADASWVHAARRASGA